MSLIGRKLKSVAETISAMNYVRSPLWSDGRTPRTSGVRAERPHFRPHPAPKETPPMNRPVAIRHPAASRRRPTLRPQAEGLEGRLLLSAGDLDLNQA